MALKDWKKTYTGKDMHRWMHKDKIAEIEVGKHYNFADKNNFYWTFVITKLQYNNKNINASYERIRNKLDALKFAKSYMRTH